MARRNLTKRIKRRALATVEMALILPLLVLFLFGIMEYGWMFFKLQQVTNAARAGARVAVIPDATTGEAQASITNFMTVANLGGSGFTATFSPADVAAAAVGSTVQVTVSVPYENIELLGMSVFPAPANLRARVGMRKEGD